MIYYFQNNQTKSVNKTPNGTNKMKIFILSRRPKLKALMECQIFTATFGKAVGIAPRRISKKLGTCSF